VYGPVRTVVWEGRSCEAPPYPDLWRRVAVHQNIDVASVQQPRWLGLLSKHGIVSLDILRTFTETIFSPVLVNPGFD
jgi:hypothetical protein